MTINQVNDSPSTDWPRVPGYVLSVLSGLWPFWVVLGIGMLHCVAVSIAPGWEKRIHSWLGFTLQVLGGILILYNVDQNLGLFGKQRLLDMPRSLIVNWPRKAVVSGTLSGAARVSGVSATGTLQSSNANASQDDRISALEAETQALRTLILAVKSDMAEHLNSVREDHQRGISSVEGQVKDVSAKLESTAVGGLRLQLLGILLAIYGGGVGLLV